MSYQSKSLVIIGRFRCGFVGHAASAQEAKSALAWPSLGRHDCAAGEGTTCAGTSKVDYQATPGSWSLSAPA